MKLVLTLTAAISLSACSTIVNGSNKGVNVTASGGQSANCTVTGGSEGAVNQTFTTPAELQIPRSKKPLEFACTQGGTQTVPGKFEATTVGNLLSWGLIGLGIDAITGSIYKYPDDVEINVPGN